MNKPKIWKSLGLVWGGRDETPPLEDFYAMSDIGGDLPDFTETQLRGALTDMTHQMYERGADFQLGVTNFDLARGAEIYTVMFDVFPSLAPLLCEDRLYRYAPLSTHQEANRLN